MSSKLLFDLAQFYFWKLYQYIIAPKSTAVLPEKNNVNSFHQTQFSGPVLEVEKQVKLICAICMPFIWQHGQAMHSRPCTASCSVRADS